MTTRERFTATLNLKKPDRYPVFEWATWWDKTLDRWRGEGMPELSAEERWDYFGLDHHKQFWLPHMSRELKLPERPHGAGIIANEADYDALAPMLYPADPLSGFAQGIARAAQRQLNGETIVWITLEGFFWFPRTLFGIENHFYAFYDYPELYHRICEDALAFQLRALDAFCAICIPEFVTIAEDMSYNHGPMLSKATFDAFVAPYYHQLIPRLKAYGIKVLVDTDGQVMPMLPWLLEAGVEGIGPLERQAGVDICQIKRDYPGILMFGGFDKMVMKRGEAAMRAEFERVLPALRAGGVMLSVDHQTPPDVPLENYKAYVRLLKEYCTRAADDGA